MRPFTLVMSAALFSGLYASTASAASEGRYCTGACDAYVVAPEHYPEPTGYHIRIFTPGERAVRRAVKRARRGPIRMRGRTRFCADKVEWHGATGIRRCVQVRNDLLGRH